MGGAGFPFGLAALGALHVGDEVVVKVSVVVANAFSLVSAMAARIDRDEVVAVQVDPLLDMHFSLHYVGVG